MVQCVSQCLPHKSPNRIYHCLTTGCFKLMWLLPSVMIFALICIEHIQTNPTTGTSSLDHGVCPHPKFSSRYSIGGKYLKYIRLSLFYCCLGQLTKSDFWLMISRSKGSREYFGRTRYQYTQFNISSTRLIHHSFTISKYLLLSSMVINLSRSCQVFGMGVADKQVLPSMPLAYY